MVMPDPLPGFRAPLQIKVAWYGVKKSVVSLAPFVVRAWRHCIWIFKNCCSSGAIKALHHPIMDPERLLIEQSTSANFGFWLISVTEIVLNSCKAIRLTWLWNSFTWSDTEASIHRTSHVMRGASWWWLASRLKRTSCRPSAKLLLVSYLVFWC